MVYQDNFTCWTDVQQAFDMKQAEPDEVLLAQYETPSYEGYAMVVYYDKGSYYVVDGSHCSCYGLEGQWEPIEYETKELVIECIRKHWRTPNGLVQLLQAHNG